nr:MlaD family protein [Gordonia desulfuricans]
MTVLKAASFVIIGLIAAVLVVNTLRVPVAGATDTYVIDFTDAEGLVAGNPVKMSGVRIGRVDGIRLVHGDNGTAKASVTVEIEKGQVVPERVQAAVRYGDMLGARYIALSPSTDTRIPARSGNEIPLAATTPPIDLTALMNGFQPLFDALEPNQVNDLARGFVDTFEGRQGSVHLLLTQIASMGENLSANGAIFARLVTNLNVLMETAERRSPQMTELFTGLNQLTSAIVGDDGQLGALLDSGDRALSSLAQMMTAADGRFASTLTGLRDVTGSWIPQTAQFEKFLDQFPVMAGKINDSGRYGGFMMLYLCNFTLKAFDLEANIFGPTHSPVCR